MEKILRVVFITIIISFGVTCVDVKPKYPVEKQILDIFVKWREGENIPFSLPRLDIITTPASNGSYAGRGVKVTFSSTEFKVVGFEKFSVEDLNVSLAELRAGGTLVIPSLSITANDYSLQGRAFYVYSLQGSGKFDVTLQNVTLKFGIKLQNSEEHTKVEKLSIDFSIGNIQANLENSSWPINKLLNSEGVKIIDQYREEILNSVVEDLVTTLDDYLATVNLALLFNSIS